MRDYYTGKKTVIFCILFFLCLFGMHAQDVTITGKEVGFDFRGEYNRAFSFCYNVSAIGEIELNNRYTIKGGFAQGMVGKDAEVRMFVSGQMAVLPGIPLYADLAWVYHTLPGTAFNLYVHSLLPYVSYNAKWAGISLGANFQFAGFMHEVRTFETIVSFSGYVHFITNEKIRLGLNIGNFGDFYTRNLTSFTYKIFSVVHLNERWSIVNDIEMLQGGADGLSSAFYGIIYRGGVRFAW